MAIAVALLALFAGVLLLVGFVPFRFAAWGTFTEARVDGRLAVTWGPTAIDASPTEGVHIRVLGRSVYRVRLRPDGREVEPSPQKATRKRRRSNRLPSWKVLVRIARRILRSVGCRARVSGCVGTGDPADTAYLFGAITMLRLGVREVDWEGLKVDWLDPRVDLEGEITGRLVVASVAWIVTSELIRHQSLRGGVS